MQTNCQEKPPTTGDRLRAQHQWHARFARGGFSTMSFPSFVDNIVATPPVGLYTGGKLIF